MRTDLRLAFVSIVLAALVAATAALAAEISSDTGAHVLRIEGPIVIGDDVRFEQELQTAHGGIVVVELASRGGAVAPALAIGRRIHQLGLSTVVPVDATCASACGLIWLGGAGRYAGWDSHLGFHTVYVTGTDGSPEISGSGSGIVGAYLFSLGANDNAIGYLLQAAPNGMSWLTIDTAREIGLPFEMITVDEALAARKRFADGNGVDRGTAIQAAAALSTVALVPAPVPEPALALPIPPAPPAPATPPAQPPIAPALLLVQQICSEHVVYGETLDAVQAALGPSVPILVLDPAHQPTGCFHPVGLLHYDDADALILEEAADHCHTCKATLSAYVLVRRNGSMSLVKTLPAFAQLGGDGHVSGPITPVKIGDDDGMAVESRLADEQGNAATTLCLFRFANGTIVHLQSEWPIPLSAEFAAWSMKGAWDLDDGEHLHIGYEIDMRDRHGTAALDFDIRADHLVVTSTKPFMAFD